MSIQDKFFIGKMSHLKYLFAFDAYLRNTVVGYRWDRPGNHHQDQWCSPSRSEQMFEIPHLSNKKFVLYWHSKNSYVFMKTYFGIRDERIVAQNDQMRQHEKDIFWSNFSETSKKLSNFHCYLSRRARANIKARATKMART